MLSELAGDESQFPEIWRHLEGFVKTNEAISPIADVLDAANIFPSPTLIGRQHNVLSLPSLTRMSSLHSEHNLTVFKSFNVINISV